MKKLAVLLVFAAIAGCATPTTSLHQPLTARPAPVPPAEANGSIYQAASSRPLFEDLRARFVGDTLIISIAEKTSATTASSTSANKAGSEALSAAVPVGLGVRLNSGASFTGSSTNKFAGSGASNGANTFSGTITVTVIEVLSNGNLVVSGEKQLAITQGNEFIRFSGVVNPAMIVNGNTVSSTQVADARIEYKENGYINDAQVMGWLGRFFLSIAPF